MKTQKLISKTRIKRIREQGYPDKTDREISAIAFGNRFAYILCSSILAVAVVTANLPLLGAMFVIAVLGFLLPYHPFDYVYNNVLAKRMKKQRIPPRSEQLKFACTIASIWIITTMFLFYANYSIAGYVMGGSLLAVAFSVSYLDFCIPSIIYNALFLRKNKALSNS